uniref:DNA topoisomerase 2 n=1 Tax=Haemonchus placei TaxID=6290 RepID=A0A0N4WRI8_HAEPC
LLFQGGKHVDHIADQIVNIIKPLVDPNLKSGIKKVVIKNHLCTFVNALIENPAFSSQTKDVLTTSVSAFGSKCVVDAAAIKEWAERSGLIEDLTSDALAREGRPPRKSRKAAVVEDLSDIVKLEDANWAGNDDRSEECRLLITEGKSCHFGKPAPLHADGFILLDEFDTGDSAKALAVAGLEVVGRDRYGVFPIMGKLTNVSGLTEEKANSTKEINHLIRILGLKYSTDYSLPKNRKTLRYGGIIILTDQDEDGSHIKGLIINFLHTYWPQLLRNGFVQSFMTPLLKARRGSETISFYNMKEFDRWKENTPDADKFTIKYYKGLGTSTSKEAREYFSNFEKHLVQFRHEDDNDDLRIRLVFDKRRSDDRKRWISERLLARDQEVTADAPKTNDITYKEFVDNELFRYSLLDLRRSIPSVVDGLKPSQRKVIHTLLRRSSNKEIKVSQLAAAVALNEGYHHGEWRWLDFLQLSAILCFSRVQFFGISCKVLRVKWEEPITRLIFPTADDELLHYLEEENQLIEPEWYCPIIPMILINGAEGIATGWSTRVLSHDINKVIDNVRRLIEGEKFEKMTPSFSDFSGSVQEIEENRFEIRGKFSFPPSQRKNASNLCLEIVELPVGEWTNRYKQNILHPLQTKGLISGFKEYHTERQVRFVVELSKEFSIRCRRPAGRYGDLMKIFKLSSVVSTNSMVLFDSLGHLKHYTTVSDIMKEHFQVRRQKYEERKEYETKMLDAQLRRSENQVISKRF